MKDGYEQLSFFDVVLKKPEVALVEKIDELHIQPSNQCMANAYVYISVSEIY